MKDWTAQYTSHPTNRDDFKEGDDVLCQDMSKKRWTIKTFGLSGIKEAKSVAPLEDGTLKDLKEECKTLGLSEKGEKAEIIDRIKEARAATEEPTPVEEETSVLKDSPVGENADV